MIGEKVRVLIVDDEQMVCDVLLNDLGERGYLCADVLSGEEALDRLRTDKYDAVLLDIRLPGVSGIEVLREIWLHHRGTATIMITGVDEVDTAVEAMKYGATDYIVKPFDFDRVDTSIRAGLLARQASASQESIAAIARGVEARMDPYSSFSSMITEGTANIARYLGIAEEEVQRWVASRTKSDSKGGKLPKLQEDASE